MNEQQKTEPDYKAMDCNKMLEALGDDAAKWTTAFCQYFPDADWGVIIGWFSNCIEASHLARLRRSMPDTRPVFIGEFPRDVAEKIEAEWSRPGRLVRS